MNSKINASKKTASFSGLLGNGSSVVVGLPSGFSLKMKLSESTCIRMATAFAHRSGWNLVSDPILCSKGDVHILAGLHFFQTEPPLLNSWLREAHRSDSFKCKVVTTNRTKWTFHPKVLIVHGPEGADFAVVGSGNLSAGGLRENVECSLYTDDPKLISDLVLWFDHVYENLADPLDDAIIRWYKRLYDKFQTRARDMRREQSKEITKFGQQVGLQQDARLKYWKKAVTDAKSYFAKPEFAQKWQELDDAAKKIRECLDYPQFNFGYGRWQEFLRIKQFGNLAALNLSKKKLSKNMDRMQKAFRIITDDSKDIRYRLDRVLEGDARVDGIAANVITKVLTIHDRTQWPVYNSKVKGVLEGYGYELPRGLSKTEKYLAFARLMQQFVHDTKAKDVYALDPFIVKCSRENRIGERNNGA